MVVGENGLFPVSLLLSGVSLVGVSSRESSPLKKDKTGRCMPRGRGLWGKQEDPAKPHTMEDFQPDL